MQADRSLFPGGKSGIRGPPKGQGATGFPLEHRSGRAKFLVARASFLNGNPSETRRGLGRALLGAKLVGHDR